jgi:hypothetical protein
MTDRKLPVDTLILIPTLKFYVFSLITDEQTDRQTDRRMEKLIRGGFPHFVPPGKQPSSSKASASIQHCCPRSPKTFSTNTRCAWAGGTFLRCLRKVPRTHSHSACVLQELTWKNRLGYPAHTGLISPSVCLSVWNMKTHRIFT